MMWRRLSNGGDGGGLCAHLFELADVRCMRERGRSARGPIEKGSGHRGRVVGQVKVPVMCSSVGKAGMVRMGWIHDMVLADWACCRSWGQPLGWLLKCQEIRRVCVCLVGRRNPRSILRL